MSSGHDFFMPNDFYEVFMPCFHAHTALVSQDVLLSLLHDELCAFESDELCVVSYICFIFCYKIYNYFILTHLSEYIESIHNTYTLRVVMSEILLLVHLPPFRLCRNHHWIRPLPNPMLTDGQI